MSLQLAKWDSGGLLLTYWCNAACADCYENSSPRKNGILPVEEAQEYLRELRLLGCTGPRFHFAGGEPFYNYEHLIGCFKVAEEEGMLPLGKLETNAFWCTKDELVRERLNEIKRFGIVELLISSDVFHQEFVPMERVQRAVRIGKKVLGEEKVRVRFWEFFQNPIEVMKLTEEQKTEVFREELKQRPERVVGRAAKALSHLVPRHPKETFADSNCAGPILRSRHIHIDPHGNIFPSGCSGLIIGNAKRQRLSKMYETFDYREHAVIEMLVEHGPVPLLEEAIQYGFEDDKEGYATKCHLCFEVRAFFWEQGLYPDEIGPGEIYTD